MQNASLVFRFLNAQYPGQVPEVNMSFVFCLVFCYVFFYISPCFLSRFRFRLLTVCRFCLRRRVRRSISSSERASKIGSCWSLSGKRLASDREFSPCQSRYRLPSLSACDLWRRQSVFPFLPCSLSVGSQPVLYVEYQCGGKESRVLARMREFVSHRERRREDMERERERKKNLLWRCHS